MKIRVKTFSITTPEDTYLPQDYADMIDGRINTWMEENENQIEIINISEKTITLSKSFTLITRIKYCLVAKKTNLIEKIV